MTAIAPVVKRGTTIVTHPSSLPPVQKPPAVVSGQVNAKELHPLPVVHLNSEDATPQTLQKQMLDLYEATRVATLPMRQDPESAPSYVRGVKFANPDTSGPQYVTQTIRHTLGRAVTGVTACRAQGGPYQGYEVPNPNGEDPAQYVTIRQLVPAGATVTHDLKITGD